MLTSLRIENFAIVSQLELEFSEGMTAFTGETGAGKSIMIDALMLALGERSDASVVRAGAEKCEIHACFDIEPTALPASWLQQHDIASDDNQIYLRRIIYAEGRSKSWINGLPFPLQKIKELSEMLVDIHGQHQHQTLLQHATHREQLDRYAKHNERCDEVRFQYLECQKIKQKLYDSPASTTMTEQMAFLTHQMEELHALALQEGEMQALHEEHQLLHHACEYLEHTERMTQLLQGEEQISICQGLHQVLQLLSHLPEHAPIKNSQELINSALIQCEEVVDEISLFATQVSLDPERLQAVEERISLLHQTARKYHVEASQLPEKEKQLQAEWTHLQQKSKEQQQWQQQYEHHAKAYETAALALRASRQTHARRLAEEISASIKLLGMPQGFITIDITPLDKMQIHGLDKIEYRVCTNPGMPPDTLIKVASGGELSRIGLAIHVITAQRGATPTLLFDEVDVGIGGATAALVGKLLRQLADRLQIFCVTHQPQVASSAHHHFIVEKHSNQEQTFSTVRDLSNTEKINEIARMLGGLTITEQSLSHARELRELQA